MLPIDGGKFVILVFLIVKVRRVWKFPKMAGREPVKYWPLRPSKVKRLTEVPVLEHVMSVGARSQTSLTFAQFRKFAMGGKSWKFVHIALKISTST